MPSSAAAMCQHASAQPSSCLITRRAPLWTQITGPLVSLCTGFTPSFSTSGLSHDQSSRAFAASDRQGSGLASAILMISSPCNISSTRLGLASARRLHALWTCRRPMTACSRPSLGSLVSHWRQPPRVCSHQVPVCLWHSGHEGSWPS